MFQDNTIKPQLSDEIKTGAAQNLKEEVSTKIADKASENINNVNSKISEPINGAVQKSNMFMNQMAQTNNPAVLEEKVWANQPTSKIHNALAIPTSQILGINRVVKLDLIIEGKEIKHFKHFKLNQSAIKHHEFSITLAHDTLGSAENHNLEEAQNFLGKRLTVIFKYKDVIDGPERNFVGVITEVGFSQEKGSLGNIVLSGFSPTILLDAAPHIQSFGGAQPISLNSIADHVIKEGLGGNKFDFRVDAQYGNVSYSSQYEETHYNYLARMAEAYGEQFFYDGEVLHFGKLPPSEQPVKLTYGSNVSDIKVRMKAQHVNPSFYGYNSSKNEKLTTGSSKITHASDIAKRAYEISEKTFTTPSLRVAPIKAASFMDIDASQKGTAGSNASQVFITSGETTVPFLYPGCTADVEMRKADSNQTSYFTKLMMIEVTHEVDARGYYTGNFEAIAADCGYIPRPEFENPRAEAQFAKVTANADPLNQGRVKVQFDWQSGQDTSEFIRVMTPDAGSSDKVNKNRGFMAIPEVGDQVIINFVHQHPDRPFVMGGMFHGGVGGGGGAGNNVKSLSSKSGNIICLNDGAGIEIKDRNGNHVTLSGTGDITTFVSNDNNEDIGNNHTTNVATKTTINVGKDQSVLTMDNAGNISLEGKTQIELKVGENKITIKKDSITISVGNGMLDMNSKDNALLVTQNNLSLYSKSNTSINATGNTVVTGKQVDIN
jgi:uncharacterized protein involved in type VI secretion and phage assembly